MAAPTHDDVDATCPFCGLAEYYEVKRDQHNLSTVGRCHITFPPVVRLTLNCKGCRRDFFHAVLGSRRIIGYHGCSREFAQSITAPGADIHQWELSENAWEWLGAGVYFWEEAPRRAWEWAEEVCRRNGGKDQPAVVGAIISPQTLIDLADTEFVRLLADAFEVLSAAYAGVGKLLPANRPFKHDENDPDRKFRALDRLVLEQFVRLFQKKGSRVEAIRAPFEEGSPVYPGAGFRSRSHVQVAVRDLARIGYVWMAPRPE